MRATTLVKLLREKGYHARLGPNGTVITDGTNGTQTVSARMVASLHPSQIWRGWR